MDETEESKNRFESQNRLEGPPTEEEGEGPPERLLAPAPLPAGIGLDRLNQALALQLSGNRVSAEALLCVGEPLRPLVIPGGGAKPSGLEGALLLVWSARSRGVGGNGSKVCRSSYVCMCIDILDIHIDR